jgi:Gram-negative bacterial TonB protein C-terminal
MISDAIEALKQELEKADGGRLLPATEEDMEQARQFGFPTVLLDFYRENAPDVADGRVELWRSRPGLDERAQSAVETWRFAPGMKDGKPVKILATVEVNFRFPQIWFDEKVERQRTSFNEALQTFRRADPGAKVLDRAVKSMEDLSRQKFPPAMHLVGIWEITGEHVTQDAADGLALIQKAAAKNYGPAMYEIAIRQIEGRDLPQRC